MNNISKTITIMILLACKPTFAMHHQFVQYMVCSAVLTASSYGICRTISDYQKRTLEDAPDNIKQWTREKLAKINIKNIDSISIKTSQDTSQLIYGHSFIVIKNKNINDADCRKELLTTKTLFHDIRQYHHNDLGKSCLLYGMSMAIPCLQLFNIPVFLSTLALTAGGNIMHRRYQEIKADEWAYMQMPSENLEIIKAEKIGNTQRFEDNLMLDPLYGERNWLERQMRPLLSYKLNSLKQHQSEQKKYIIKLAEFIAHFRRPNSEQQITLIQECLDKKQNKS